MPIMALVLLALVPMERASSKMDRPGSNAQVPLVQARLVNSSAPVVLR